jgi:hypothetical protein
LIKTVDGQANIDFASIEAALLFRIASLSLSNSTRTYDCEEENTVTYSKFYCFEQFKGKNSKNTECVMK